MRFFFIIVIVTCFALESNAQCNPRPYVDKAIKGLEKGYTFLKGYPISGEAGKKYSYIFSQGTNYLISLANNDSRTKGVYITLYDSNQKKVASSYADGQFYKAISFSCKRTGIYHMKFSFERTKEYCAAGVLSMRR